MKTVLAIALTALLTACAATTPRIEPARLNAVEKGRTTAAEVMRQFGTPTLHSKNPDGTQSATYVHGDQRSGSTSIVPLMAVGSRDSVTFYFDARGLLTDVKTTQAVARSTAAAARSSAAPGAGSAVPGQTTATRPTADADSSPGESRTWWLPDWLPPSTIQNR